MTLRVEFEGGPADGIEQDYPALTVPLPSLYWSRTANAEASIYRRSADQPDPTSGRWRYQFSPRDNQR